MIETPMAGRAIEEVRKATRAYSQSHPVDAAGHAGSAEHGAHGPFGWVSLVIVVGLVIGGWFVVRQMQADSNMQDCVMSGRKNCAPVDTDSLRATPSPP
jgi:hypothetical protein